MTTLPWCRWYQDALLDRALLDMPPYPFKVYALSLSLALRFDGVIPPAADVAYYLHESDEGKIGRALAILVKGGYLLESPEGGYTISDWERRILPSAISAPRVKALRDRQKAIEESPRKRGRPPKNKSENPVTLPIYEEGENVGTIPVVSPPIPLAPQGEEISNVTSRYRFSQNENTPNKSGNKSINPGVFSPLAPQGNKIGNVTEEKRSEQIKGELNTPTVPPENGGTNGEDFSPGFIRWWSSWPPHFRKEDKQKCWLHWRTKHLDLREEEIMLGLHQWKQSEQWRKDGGKYIPGPLTWLRRERWESPPPISIPPAISQNGHLTSGEKKAAGIAAYAERHGLYGTKSDERGATGRIHAPGGTLSAGDPDR